jgi:hypothetical protein
MSTTRRIPGTLVLLASLLALAPACGGFYLGFGGSASESVSAAAHAENRYEGVARVDATIVVQTTVAVEGHSRFFGIPIAGSSVAYVIDTSGSMEALDPGGMAVSSDVGTQIGMALLGGLVGDTIKMRKIDTAKSELHHCLSSMPAHTAFNLRAFNDDEIPFYKTPVPTTAENVGYARGFVDGLEPRGGTVIIDALENALKSGTDTVVLLSDGQPNDSEEPGAIKELVAAEHAKTGVVVHVVGLGMDQDDDLLRSIAASTGGAYAVR